MVHLALPEALLISELSRSSDWPEWKPTHSGGPSRWQAFPDPHRTPWPLGKGGGRAVG